MSREVNVYTKVIAGCFAATVGIIVLVLFFASGRYSVACSVCPGFNVVVVYGSVRINFQKAMQLRLQPKIHVVRISPPYIIQWHDSGERIDRVWSIQLMWYDEVRHVYSPPVSTLVIVLWPIALVSLYAGTYVLWRVRMRSILNRNSFACKKCSYDLCGTVGIGTCPECGEAIASSSVRDRL